ncbi:DUF192 domain-containing protein [Candidatus Giovannonibacteria bacterium]|nr:DUF192 domain-containing protein [Candidatus Giovannonibacteria bacterium]
MKRGTVFMLIIIAPILAAVFFALNRDKTENAAVEIGGVTIAAEIARTPRERAKGLSGREGLAQDEGMLFIFSNPALYDFWMKDMKFPIDIIWINNGKIVYIAENAKPPAPNTLDNELTVYHPTELASYVFEVQSAFVEQHGIKVGDDVKLIGNIFESF